MRPFFTIRLDFLPNLMSLTWDYLIVYTFIILYEFFFIKGVNPVCYNLFVVHRKNFFLLSLLVLALGILACNVPVDLLSKNSTRPTTLPPQVLPPTPSPIPTATTTPTPEPAARVESAEAALLHGDWDTAQEEFQSAETQTSDRETKFTAQLGQARAELLSGNAAAALDKIEPLISEMPVLSDEIQATPQSLVDKVSQAYFLLAQAYSSIERYTESSDAYTKYLQLRPGLIDAYVYDLRGDALFAGEKYLDAAQSFNAALQSSSQLDRTYIEMKLARSYALAGQSEQALAIYDDLYTRSGSDNTRALIDLRKGQLFESIDQPEQAYDAYLDAVTNFPTAFESYSALLTLVEAGIPVDDLNRGLVDFFAGEYGMALAAFDRYLSQTPADPGTALYYSGLAHRAGGRNDKAIESWDLVIQNHPDHPYWDEAWEQKGFTQWYYMEDYAAAIDTFETFTRTNPAHPRAAEFLDDAARVSERSGDLERAASLWRSLTLEYPLDERAPDGLFLAGISNYRLGMYSEALDHFKNSLGIAPTPSDQARAYLWIAKTYAKLNDPENYEQALINGAEVDPTGYYSERSRDLLRGSQPFDPPQVFDIASDPESEKKQADAWMRKTFFLDESQSLDFSDQLAQEPVMVRASELWNLGLYEESRLEFESLREAVASDPVLTYQLAGYFSKIGLYRSATFAARRVLDIAGMDDASSLVAPVYFNRIRFGTYFSDMINSVSQQYNIHPLLAFSLIRQESLFESFVESSASARGLMQIIPSTGQDIASRLNWPENYTDSDLNRPIVNITFGMYYLSQQLELFEGDIYTALAAYNGGPGNAAQWKELSGADYDLFLEVIRYSETREYIRRIYEIFTIYRRLYDRSP
jgi:soluble lytic murein transglycosylase